MITEAFIYRANQTDPHKNLAVEELLLQLTLPGQCFLYLWQNRHTVVIGRNQSAHAECKIDRLRQDDGFLARRLSGGGAVYHDSGNLNFTFLVREQDYDIDRQLSVIACACARFGLNAEKSGRNDLCVDGKKFSGNAFYSHRGHCYHHGTILLDVNTEKMAEYLNVPADKLRSKGVASVKSRVVNLCALNPQITVEGMSLALIDAFGEIYAPPREIALSAENENEIARLTEKYSSEGWLIGRKIRADCEISSRFTWGGLSLNLQIEGGAVKDAQVFSDSMDETVSATLELALTGAQFSRDALVCAVNAQREALSAAVADDIAELIKTHEIW